MTNIPNNFSKKDFENQYKQIGKVFSPFFNCYSILILLDFTIFIINGQQNQRSQEELELRSRLTLLVSKFLKEKNTPSAFRLRDYNNGFWEKYWSFVAGYEYRN